MCVYVCVIERVRVCLCGQNVPENLFKFFVGLDNNGELCEGARISEHWVNIGISIRYFSN